MKDKIKLKENEESLKKLKDKTTNSEVRASIDKKLQGLKQPFNK